MVLFCLHYFSFVLTLVICNFHFVSEKLSVSLFFVFLFSLDNLILPLCNQDIVVQVYIDALCRILGSTGSKDWL